LLIIKITHIYLTPYLSGVCIYNEKYSRRQL
jgi:hypothetical protein